MNQNGTLVDTPAKQLLQDLQDHGFIINWEKAVLTPTQVIKFLGFVVCSVSMRLYVPAEKVQQVEELVSKLTKGQDGGHTFRELARIAGKLVAMAMAIPPVRIFTRETFKCIRPPGVEGWDEMWDHLFFYSK